MIILNIEDNFYYACYGNSEELQKLKEDLKHYILKIIGNNLIIDFSEPFELNKGEFKNIVVKALIKLQFNTKFKENIVFNINLNNKEE